MWSEAIREATREYDRASWRLYVLTRRVREIVIFVGSDGVAHLAVDWLGPLRMKRLAEKKPTHKAPRSLQ